MTESPTKVKLTLLNGQRVSADTPGAEKRRVVSKKWYGCSIPGYPPNKRIPLATDKSVAQRMLAKLIDKGERGEAGIEDTTTEARRVPLSEHLENFEAHLSGKGTSERTIRDCLSRVRAILDACCFDFPQDINAESIDGYLSGRRQVPANAGGLSVATSNYYAAAINQFCKWMVKTGRLTRNPAESVYRLNPAHDQRHHRRSLEPDELTRLLEAVRESKKTYRGLTGEDRHALYLAACGTGFRASELACLTPESFDFDTDPPTVILPVKKGKSKKKTVE